MCDTLVVIRDDGRERQVVFGKNSDRPQNEIQDVVSLAKMHHAVDTTVQCTHLSIPQVRETHALLLSKPRWMWGAEMGANCAGVVIGNEAVWTTEPLADTGLTGMDLVRLALERADSATLAMQVIVALLERFGQGGSHAEQPGFNYHNSFLIADLDGAWVLETAGQYWVAERVVHGSRTISNNLSIDNAGDHRCRQLDAVIAESESFSFAAHFTPGGRAPAPDNRELRVRNSCRLAELSFTAETAKAILRDHQEGICMHGAFETRGSQISVLSGKTADHWFIEKPFPCRQAYVKRSFS